MHVQKLKAMTPLFVNNTIAINASADKVWDVLTNPEQTRKYMFGCEALSDYQPGSPLTWEGNFGGQHMVAVKGHVVDIRPGEYLAYTVIDPNNTAIADVPENYLTVTYKLTENNGTTTLDVSQGDFSKVAEGEKRYKDAHNNGEGWKPILVQIKAIAEGV